MTDSQRSNHRSTNPLQSHKEKETKMRIPGKKRLLLAAGSAATVGAVATLVSGVTFGLFSASEPSGSNSFTSGTVSVGLDTAPSVTCTIPANTPPPSYLVPGDSSTGASIDNAADPQCSYNVKYTGNVPAWVAVDVAVVNSSGTLYDHSNKGLQLYLSDDASAPNDGNIINSTATDTGGSGTTYLAQGGGATALPVGTTGNILLNAGGATPTAATNGSAYDMNLDYALPLDSGNTYQTGTTTVTLTFHAVQKTNQTLPATCATNHVCGAAAGFAWS